MVSVLQHAVGVLHVPLAPRRARLAESEKRGLEKANCEGLDDSLRATEVPSPSVG